MYVSMVQLTKLLAISGDFCSLFSPFSLKFSELFSNASAAYKAIWLTDIVVKDVTSSLWRQNVTDSFQPSASATSAVANCTSVHHSMGR